MTGKPGKYSLALFAILTLFYAAPAMASSQDTVSGDTLKRAWTSELPEFFVTATRTVRNSEEIPVRVNSIKAGEIETMPVFCSDGLLEMVPGANIDRANGIFSKNASITMRGLNGTPRTLILMDGVPLNKADGGGINWNRVIPDFLDRVEVSKGPTSSVYGSNAMGGVINLITSRPSARLEGMVKTFAGSYGTFGGLLSVGGKTGESGQGLYYQVNGFYRQGDGYIIVPETARDSMDIRTSLRELLFSGKIGCRYDRGSYTEIEYTHYEDKRGDGFRVYEPGGGYNEYPTEAIRVTSSNDFGRLSILVSAFSQDEFYHRLAESLAAKKGNKYSMYKTDSRRIDMGFWTNATWRGKRGMSYTLGIDIRSGSVDGSDTYYTSTDVLTNKGKMNFYALFGEYEWHTLKEKMIILAGLRFDMARFYDGSFVISEPTSLTSFMAAYPTVFSDQDWHAVSPKIGLKYFFSGRMHAYAMYSRGFRPPMLDDMCKNGNVTKGFKLANPQLKPETIDNYELGCDWRPVEGLVFRPSVYCSLGKDFQYFINTGDSINTGGDKDKPIIRRENVSRVRVLGAEASLQWQVCKKVSLAAAYAYNDSRITEFSSPVDGKDLSGKFIMEVPRNQLSAGVSWNNRFVTASLTYTYRDDQWSDDENTQVTPGYSLFDLKLGHLFFKKLNVNCIVQDIFNTRFYDSKGNLSPGRFFMLNLSYRFSKI